MKKLIFIFALVAIATLSTFPVKETEALNFYCTPPTEYSDGSAVKTCTDGYDMQRWKRDCGYCVWRIESTP